MGYWQEKIVYIRDFAYPPRHRLLRMASENVSDVPAASFAELLSGPIVDIYVGDARQHWSIHRNLLCHHSEFFYHEFLPNENHKKPPTELNLLHDDPVGFELLVKWLYQGKLESVSDMPDPYRKYDFAVACHSLYLLCDRFEMVQLKNMAMDQYRRGLSEARLVPDAEEINEIYRRSAPGSPFRQLMTKIAARQIMDPDSDKDAAQYSSCFKDNPEFAIDLVNAIRHDSGGVLFDDPTEGDACQYHDHEDEPTCNIKGKSRQGFFAYPGRKRKISPSKRSSTRIHGQDNTATATAAAEPATAEGKAKFTEENGRQHRPTSPLSPPDSPPNPPSPVQVGNRNSPPSTPRVSSIVDGVHNLSYSAPGPERHNPIRSESNGGSPQRGRRVGSAASTPRRPPPKLERRGRGSSKGSAGERSEAGQGGASTGAQSAEGNGEVVSGEVGLG